MRSKAYFTNLPCATTTPRVDQLAISSSRETTAMHALPVSVQSGSTSVLSAPPTPPCSDAQRREQDHFLPRPRPSIQQSRLPLFPEARPPKLDLSSRPQARNHALGSLRPRLPLSTSVNRLEPPADDLSALDLLALHSASVLQSPNEPSHSTSSWPSAAQPSLPASDSQAARRDPGRETSRLLRPLYHHFPPRPSMSSPRREGLVSVAVSRRPRSTLRTSTPSLFSRHRSSPRSPSSFNLSVRPHGFPRRHNETALSCGLCGLAKA